jgi:hypothetical protein
LQASLWLANIMPVKTSDLIYIGIGIKGSVIALSPRSQFDWDFTFMYEPARQDRFLGAIT